MYKSFFTWLTTFDSLNSLCEGRANGPYVSFFQAEGNSPTYIKSPDQHNIA